MPKGIVTKIHDQISAAEKIGQLCCAFSVEDTKLILAQLGKATKVRDKFDSLLARAVRE